MNANATFAPFEAFQMMPPRQLTLGRMVPVTQLVRTERTHAATAAHTRRAPVDRLKAGRAEAKRFRDAFGDEGPQMFADGLSFEEARTRQLRAVSDGLADIRANLPAERRGFSSRIRFASSMKIRPGCGR